METLIKRVTYLEGISVKKGYILQVGGKSFKKCRFK